MKKIKLFENFDVSEAKITWDMIDELHQSIANAVDLDIDDLEVGGGDTYLDVFFKDKNLTDTIIKHIKDEYPSIVKTVTSNDDVKDGHVEITTTGKITE